MSLTQPSKTSDASGGHPFCHKDIAIVVKAGVMGMNKFSLDPSFGVATVDSFLLDHAFNVIT